MGLAGEGLGSNLTSPAQVMKARQNRDSKGEKISTAHPRHVFLSVFFS